VYTVIGINILSSILRVLGRLAFGIMVNPSDHDLEASGKVFGEDLPRCGKRCSPSPMCRTV